MELILLSNLPDERKRNLRPELIKDNQDLRVLMDLKAMGVVVHLDSKVG